MGKKLKLKKRKVLSYSAKKKSFSKLWFILGIILVILLFAVAAYAIIHVWYLSSLTGDVITGYAPVQPPRPAPQVTPQPPASVVTPNAPVVTPTAPAANPVAAPQNQVKDSLNRVAGALVTGGTDAAKCVASEEACKLFKASSFGENFFLLLVAFLVAWGIIWLVHWIGTFLKEGSKAKGIINNPFAGLLRNWWFMLILFVACLAVLYLSNWLFDQVSKIANTPVYLWFLKWLLKAILAVALLLVFPLSLNIDSNLRFILVLFEILLFAYFFGFIGLITRIFKFAKRNVSIERIRRGFSRTRAASDAADDVNPMETDD